MSDLDLTEAETLRERVARALYEREAASLGLEPVWVFRSPGAFDYKRMADAALTAAAPRIEAQVRERAVAALEQVASDRSYDSDETITEAYLDAARIVALGESA